jgi:type III secretion protein L
MNALIKAGGDGALGARVQPLAGLPSGEGERSRPDLLVSAERLALDRQVRALQVLLAERDAELVALRGQLGQAFQEGEAQGLKAGLAQADQRRADQLQRLEQGINSALQLYTGELKSMERLAVLLAREGLAKLIGDPSRHGDLLVAILRAQLARIEEDSVLAILVPRADFGDTEALVKLAARIGRSDITIQASDGLAAGECRIKMKLGILDVGLAQQWRRLSAALEAMAMDGAP